MVNRVELDDNCFYINYDNGLVMFWKNVKHKNPTLEINGKPIYWSCENAILHRKDGPAVKYSNGNKEWYINGERLSREKEMILNKWWDNKNGI